MTYQEAMMANTRELDIRGFIMLADTTVISLTNEHIMAYSIDEGGASIPLGSAAAASYGLELANAQGEWFPGGSIIGLRVIQGARVEIEIGVHHDGAFEYKPAGVWYVNATSGREGGTRFVLRGADALLTTYDDPLDDSGFSYGPETTLNSLLIHIKATHSLTVAGALACNTGAVIAQRPDWGAGCTVRNALGFIAAAGGCFVRVDRSGGLQLVPVKSGAAAKPISTESYLELENANAYFAFNRIKVMPRGAQAETPYTEGAVNAGLPEAGNNTIVMTDNPLLAVGADNLQAMVTALAVTLSGYSIDLLSFRYRGDPTFVLGDMVQVTDRRGKAITTPVLQQTLKYGAGLSATISSMVALEMMQPSTISKNGTLMPIAFGKGSLDPSVLILRSITAKYLAANTITADEIDVSTLTAEIADIALAQITTANMINANIEWADIENLKSAMITAFKARIEYLIANELVTDELYAALAEIATAEIGTADIDWANIKDLVSGRAIFEQGTGGKLYIADLAVTEANMVSLTVGELIVRGADGLFYAVSVDGEGNVTTELKQIADGDIEDEGITGSTKIIEGSVTADRLNATDIFADNAIIRQLMAANLDVDVFFAREGVVNKLTLDYVQPLNDKITILENETSETNSAIDQLEVQREQVEAQVAWLTEAKLRTDNYIQIGHVMMPDGNTVFGMAVGKDVDALNPDGTISTFERSMTVQSAASYIIFAGGQRVGEFDATGLSTESAKVNRLEINKTFFWQPSQSGGLVLKKGG